MGRLKKKASRDGSVGEEETQGNTIWRHGVRGAFYPTLNIQLLQKPSMPCAFLAFLPGDKPPVYKELHVLQHFYHEIV